MIRGNEAGTPPSYLLSSHLVAFGSFNDLATEDTHAIMGSEKSPDLTTSTGPIMTGRYAGNPPIDMNGKLE